MKFKPGAIVLALAVLVPGCDNPPTEVTESARSLVYSHAFESPADTIGWSEYGSLELYPSAPSGGGSWSVRVSGGCLVPHAHASIRIQSDAGPVVLQCWGKNLATGGSVQLHKKGDRSTSIWIQVTDTSWMKYRSSGTLNCSANDTLELEMASGGIIFSAMLIDNLEIQKVQN